MTDEEIRENIGKELRTRDGRIAVVLGEVPEPQENEQWVGYIVTSEGTHQRESWFSDGTYARDGEDLDDLMPAPPPEMWVNVYTSKDGLCCIGSSGMVPHSSAAEARENRVESKNYLGPHRLVPEGGE